MRRDIARPCSYASRSNSVIFIFPCSITSNSSRHFLKGWESLNGFADLLFGCAKFVEALEIEPELRASAEEVGKTQSGVPGYGAPAVDNSRDAIGGNPELARESGGAHIESLQFFGQVLPRMDCDQCHWRFSPSDNQRSRRWRDLERSRATRSKSKSRAAVALASKLRVITVSLE